MLVLGIDTSTTNGSVVITDDGEVVSCITAKGAGSHSRNLLTLIHKALTQSKRTLESMDVFSVSVGPGSFTGLRIGLGTVLGLSDSISKPMIGVDTLDAMARSQIGWDGGYICPVVHARKGEIYTALFVSGKNGLEKLTGDLALSPESLSEMIDRPTRFLGDGFDPYSDIFNSLLTENFEVVNAENESYAEGVAGIALERALNTDFDERLEPRYVRRSQAEINWEKRQQ